MTLTLAEKDKKYIWHPYTQMKDALPVIPIVYLLYQHILLK